MNNIQRWCITGFIGIIAMSIFLIALSSRYESVEGVVILDKWTGNVFLENLD